MPLYYLYCPKKHVTVKAASMKKMPKTSKCQKCKRRAKLGLAPTILSGSVKNLPLDRKQRELFKTVFGKKKAAKMRTTADVDANLQDFACRYPHLMPGYKRGRTYDLNSASDLKELGTPGDRLNDPFPSERISEDPRNNMNGNSRR